MPIAPSPRVVTTLAELRPLLAAQRAAGHSIGLVPTMGALHTGHLSLVEASRRQCGFTVVTIFVNPTQFGPGEDFQKYPRTLAADLAALATCGPDLVFAPANDEVYRSGHATFVEMQGVALPLEGQRRPGHFRGVATVVLKLFNMVQPDFAFFGQKDYQQTRVIRQLVDDLDLPITIQVCPIVREVDGLALSSRNVYLNATQRRQALVLNRSLHLAEELVAAGGRDSAVILARMHELFAAEPEVRIDYIALVDRDTLLDVATVSGTTLAVIAAFVGKTRLIDNQLLDAGNC